MIKFCFWLITLFAIANDALAADDNVSINLAIRKACDLLLRSEGDSISKISPISQNGNEFDVKINGKFNYDKLPFYLNQSFQTIGLDKTYNVSIKDCANDLILVGFNSQDATDGEVACQGRLMETSTCHRVILSFTELSTKKKFNLLYILAPLALMAFVWSKLGKHAVIVTDPNDSISANQNKQSIGNSIIDMTRLSIMCDGKTESMTHLEAQLLSFLYENIGNVVDRDTIMTRVWNDDNPKLSRSLDVFISRLRKKLAHDTSIQISAIHGIGYKLDVILRDC